MARVRRFNPGDRVIVPNGDSGEVICTHNYPDRPSCCDVRVAGVGLIQVVNSELEMEFVTSSSADT